jgi:hypothetical protein
VDIYALLELLVRAARLAEPIERDALELIEQLRKINAFGTMTGNTAITDHAPAGINYFNRVCTLCHKEHEE